MCLRLWQSNENWENKKIESIPKWFSKIDDILNPNFSNKLECFNGINSQIEVCEHTLQEVKTAIDDVLKLWYDFVWYKNNWLCRHLNYYFKDWWNIEDLTVFVEYKFYTIDMIENFLKKSFWWEWVVDLFIENFNKNRNFSVKVEFLSSEKEKYIECNFFGSDNLVNHYYTLLWFYNKVNELKWKWGLRINFINQSE